MINSPIPLNASTDGRGLLSSPVNREWLSCLANGVPQTYLSHSHPWHRSSYLVNSSSASPRTNIWPCTKRGKFRWYPHIVMSHISLDVLMLCLLRASTGPVDRKQQWCRNPSNVRMIFICDISAGLRCSCPFSSSPILRAGVNYLVFS